MSKFSENPQPEQRLIPLPDLSPVLTDDESLSEGRKKKKKYLKHLKKMIIPLLIAYKLKFFALIPLLMKGLLVLVGSMGMAGFFFALFAATIGIKSYTGH